MTDHERHPVEGDDPRVKAVAEANVRVIAEDIRVALSKDDVTKIASDSRNVLTARQFIAMYDAAQRFPFSKSNSKDSK